MDDSDSSLSSAPPTDDESMKPPPPSLKGLDRYFKPTAKSTVQKSSSPASPEPPKRAPSPPHEYILADNDTIAFLVMFRSRFSDAFPKSLPHYGPQDIERGVTGDMPDEQVERLLCALLGLVLNRKKDVERGHYGRALEDAVGSNQNQWLPQWHGTNPLHGGKSFNNMTPEERLLLLRALALWSLSTSEALTTLLKTSYKQTRRDDDKNQPRSVQPWFSDSLRRRYWLIEGQEDSYFRVYRENDGKTSKSNTWFSVAGSIDEVNALADKLAGEGGQNNRLNAEKLRSVIPRFEQGEEKRRRKEYRVARKMAFARPEPGYSMYEGRTRGKRMRYTYEDGQGEDDDENDQFESDGTGGGGRRSRSTRNATPVDTGPTVTASGRQVKSRLGGMYGESLSTDQRREVEAANGNTSVSGGSVLGGDDGEDSDDVMPATAPRGRAGRPMRAAVTSAAANAGKTSSKKQRGNYGDDDDVDDDMDSDSDEAADEGDEWSGNEDELDGDGDADEEDDDDEDDDVVSEEDLSGDDGDGNRGKQGSLVVQLRYGKGTNRSTPAPAPGENPSRARSPLHNLENGISPDTETAEKLVPRQILPLSSMDTSSGNTNGASAAQTSIPPNPTTEQVLVPQDTSAPVSVGLQPGVASTQKLPIMSGALGGHHAHALQPQHQHQQQPQQLSQQRSPLAMDVS